MGTTIAQWRIEILTSIRYSPASIDDLIKREFIKGHITREWVDRFCFFLENDGYIKEAKSGKYHITIKGLKKLR